MKIFATLRRKILQLELVERWLLVLLAICLIRPLTIPNWIPLGYTEIKLDSQPQCEQLPALDQNIFRELTPAAIARILHLENGGLYRNKLCKNGVQQVAIIVPYRNRSEHLHKFVHHIHPFLVNQNAISYQIFVVEQDDQLPFNRGHLLNIGFREALLINPSIDCFVFHDVDILPSDQRQLYTCSDVPRHLCSYLDKFRYILIYPSLFGGVIAVKRQQFIQTNGYSNMYNGWGGEDDDFYLRVRYHFSHIERYTSDVARCVMINHRHDDISLNLERKHLLRNAIQRSTNDGLSNLNGSYVLKRVEYRPLYVKLLVTFQ